MSNDNNAVDDAVNDAENAENAKKTRTGKIDKRSIPRGKKQRFWVCFALKGKTPIAEMYPWPPPNEDGTTQDPRPDKESADACAALFKEKHERDPLTVFGPVYEVKDKAAPDQQRVAVSLTTKDLLRKTSKAYSGTYRGWVVMGNGLKAVTDADGNSYKDNELIAPLFDSVINPEDKPTKPRIKDHEAMRLSDLEDVQEL
jgi:hypothetical protein